MCASLSFTGGRCGIVARAFGGALRPRPGRITFLASGTRVTFDPGLEVASRVCEGARRINRPGVAPYGVVTNSAYVALATGGALI